MRASPKPTEPGSENNSAGAHVNVTGLGPNPEPDHVLAPLIFDTPIDLEPTQPNNGDTD
jgi:hypothetical protein